MTTSTSSAELKTLADLDRVDLPGRPGATPPGSRNPKKRALLWLVLLLGIVAVAGYAVWRAHQPAVPQRTQQGGRGGREFQGPVPVVVAKVGRSDMPVYVNGLGNVSPYYTDTIKSRVDGQIMKVDFNEGDLVKEGQVLIEIDPRPYQVQLDMAQATLARDQALLANAKVDLARYNELLPMHAVPKQQLDTQAALVAQYEATIKQDIASINNAKLQLIYAKITAPITGVVGLRLVDPGNIIHASDTSGMVVITQIQPVAVLFTIPEDSLPQVTQKLRAGAHLPVEAFNRDTSQKLATGRLMTLDNQIDSTTGTARLKAVFANKDFALFPQQFVNIRLLVDTLTHQLVVPNVAVQNGQQGTFVYVVDENSKVHLKTVQVGITSQTSADILSGLTDGDRVVVDGTDRLSEGARVRLRRPGESNSPGGAEGAGGGNSPRHGAGSQQGEGRHRNADGSFKKGHGGGGSP